MGSHAHADEQRRGPTYGVAAAEVTGAAVVAIHLTTASSPGSGGGLVLNFAPMVVGIGAGIAAERADLDPRIPLGFHGALMGGLSMLAIGAAIDGRDDADDGVALGPAALTLAPLGMVGGALLGATIVDDLPETGGFLAAPFGGALAGGVTFAIVHFFDDEGPRSTGRLVGFVGGGMLLGTAGSLLFSIPDRTPRPAIVASGRATMITFGGTF